MWLLCPHYAPFPYDQNVSGMFSFLKKSSPEAPDEKTGNGWVARLKSGLARTSPAAGKSTTTSMRNWKPS